MKEKCLECHNNEQSPSWYKNGELVERTIDEAGELEEKLLDIAENGKT